MGSPISSSRALVTPNAETRLAKLNGDGYPFAAGARDLSFNYEPTFAPVPSGGLLLGRLHGAAARTATRTSARRNVVKQLWVTRPSISIRPSASTRATRPSSLPGQGRDVDQHARLLGARSLQGGRQGLRLRHRVPRRFLCDGTGTDGGSRVQERRHLLAGRRSPATRPPTAATPRAAARATTTCAPSPARSSRRRPSPPDWSQRAQGEQRDAPWNAKRVPPLGETRFAFPLRPLLCPRPFATKSGPKTRLGSLNPTARTPAGPGIRTALAAPSWKRAALRTRGEAVDLGVAEAPPDALRRRAVARPVWPTSRTSTTRPASAGFFTRPSS